MILVTGASGKTGKALIRRMLQHGALVRAVVHRGDEVEELRFMGVSEIVVGDMRRQPVMQRAAIGVETIYHIPPNMCADEVKIGRLVIQSARDCRVRHLVYHSVLHPYVRQMPHHWKKARVEELIFASGLCYTILQPTVYMQNIQAQWPKVLAQGIYPVPYAAKTRLGMVDLEDVVEVAVRVVLERGFDNGIYELVGTPSLTQNELVDVISEKIGRTVQVRSISLSNWEENARQNGMNAYAIRTLIQMFSYYEKYGMGGSPATLQWLLQRHPTTISQFVDRLIQN